MISDHGLASVIDFSGWPLSTTKRFVEHCRDHLGFKSTASTTDTVVSAHHAHSPSWIAQSTRGHRSFTVSGRLQGKRGTNQREKEASSIEELDQDARFLSCFIDALHTPCLGGDVSSFPCRMKHALPTCKNLDGCKWMVPVDARWWLVVLPLDFPLSGHSYPAACVYPHSISH